VLLIIADDRSFPDAGIPDGRRTPAFIASRAREPRTPRGAARTRRAAILTGSGRTGSSRRNL
jgi:hypothetical protein